MKKLSIFWIFCLYGSSITSSFYHKATPPRSCLKLSKADINAQQDTINSYKTDICMYENIIAYCQQELLNTAAHTPHRNAVYYQENIDEYTMEQRNAHAKLIPLENDMLQRQKTLHVTIQTPEDHTDSPQKYMNPKMATLAQCQQYHEKASELASLHEYMENLPERRTYQEYNNWALLMEQFKALRQAFIILDTSIYTK